MPTTRAPDILPWPGADEAHVWMAVLAEQNRGLPALAGLLSPEEKQRAARFFRPEDRARFVVAHGILRQLLGRYLAAAPAAIEFVTNAAGKPGLENRGAMPPLAFNLSHSGDVILYAVAGGRRVGVDVEIIRTDFDVMALARSQFSPGEIAALAALPATERDAAFFRCWTRKEAYVKALGAGLGCPLQDFSVRFVPATEAGLDWVKDDPDAPAGWSARALDLPAGYAGAVFAEGAGVRFSMRSVPAPR